MVCEGCGGALELQALAFQYGLWILNNWIAASFTTQSTASYNLAAFVKLFKNPGPKLMEEIADDDQTEHLNNMCGGGGG